MKSYQTILIKLLTYQVIVFYLSCLQSHAYKALLLYFELSPGFVAEVQTTVLPSAGSYKCFYHQLENSINSILHIFKQKYPKSVFLKAKRLWLKFRTRSHLNTQPSLKSTNCVSQETEVKDPTLESKSDKTAKVSNKLQLKILPNVFLVQISDQT